MKPSITLWQIGGFVFTAIVGAVLHFLYDWTGKKKAAGIFGAVNESTWEHMKLLYFPMLVFGMVEYGFWGAGMAQFWCVKLAGMLFGLALIPALYYTYTGALGVEADWFNITIFFLAAAGAYWMETDLLRRTPACQVPPVLCLAALVLVGVAFGLLTFLPPRRPLFLDPQTGDYGISTEKE